MAFPHTNIHGSHMWIIVTCLPNTADSSINILLFLVNNEKRGLWERCMSKIGVLLHVVEHSGSFNSKARDHEKKEHTGYDTITG